MRGESIVAVVVLFVVAVGGISTVYVHYLYDTIVKELRESYPEVWRRTGCLQPWRKEVMTIWDSVLKSHHVPASDLLRKGGLPVTQIIKQEAVFRELLPASASVLNKIRIIKWIFNGTFVFAFISFLIIVVVSH